MRTTLAATRRVVVGLVLLLGIASSVQAAFPVRARNVQGIGYVWLSDLADYYGLGVQTNGRQILLQSSRHSVEMSLDDRATRINGVAMHFSYPPLADQGTLLLSQADFVLVLDPLLRPQGLPQRRIRRICIDPGHGGQDQGAIGARLHIAEKQLNLVMAKRLAALLIGQGYQVTLTRSDDRFIPLSDRAAAATNWQADLFISMHANSNVGAGPSGIETWRETPEGAPGTYDRSSSRGRISADLNDLVNSRLAYEIQKALVFVSGAEDRGTKHARFVVLRETACPAVLVEVGFLSNPEEEARLATASYQQSLATAIAKGIISLNRLVER